MEEQKQQKKKKKQGGIFYKIYSGNILRDERITKNAGLFALVVFYIIIYISNRYAFQQELHKIADLKDEVKILKYDVLTQQSELSEKSRQSNIEKHIKENDSKLKTATNPPYTIK